MMLLKWKDLPPEFQNDQVKKYYNILRRKTAGLVFKRIFDIAVSGVMIVLLSPLLLVISVIIKLDSKGPVFFRQTRITQYNREFRIFKFRTMFENDGSGAQVTVKGDERITRAGRFLRRFRLDETAQLFDVFRGKMTFVGTRPEVAKYIEKYTPEMMATLLLPAGITSLASIYFKDEDSILSESSDVESAYVDLVLPKKMYYNLKAIENFGLFEEIKIMIMTVLAVLGKNYTDKYNEAADESEERTVAAYKQ